MDSRASVGAAAVGGGGALADRPVAGTIDSSLASRPRPSRPPRRTSHCRPDLRYSVHAARSSVRPPPETSITPSRRAMRVRSGRRSASRARPPSRMCEYGTRAGHTSSQRPHDRHPSRCDSMRGLASIRPVSRPCTSMIRPRGESPSCCESRYVGQCGRHRPHFTQRSASASSVESSGEDAGMTGIIADSTHPTGPARAPPPLCVDDTFDMGLCGQVPYIIDPLSRMASWPFFQAPASEPPPKET